MRSINHMGIFSFFFLSLQRPVVLGGLPSQVLTRFRPAWLLRSDEIGCVQGDMAIDRDF